MLLFLALDHADDKPDQHSAKHDVGDGTDMVLNNLSLLLGGLGGAILVAGLKTLFHRPSPLEIFAPLGYSFPSGNAVMATVVYEITI